MTGMHSQSLPDAMAAMARAHMGPGFAVAGADVGGAHPALWPGEGQAIERAIEKRRREFSAGRAAARAALAELGVPPAAILAGPDRAPIWPQGSVGSITHSGPLALAIAARSETAPAVGIDVEDAAPLEEGLMRFILTEAERGRIATWPLADQLAHGKAAFVAKECAYKAQYPLTKQVFGFHGMEVAIKGGAFVATRVDGAGAVPMKGRISSLRGFLLATLALEP